MDEKFKIAVLLSGRGSNFEALEDHIRVRNAAIETVVAISDRPDANGLRFAASRGIPTRVVERQSSGQSVNDYGAAVAAALTPFTPELVVLAGFKRILGTEFISAFPNRIVNIHPSLLPAFKGLHAQRQAIIAGVKFAGCTVHLVIPEVDAGRILAQAVVQVFPDDTEETLSTRILAEEHILLPEVVCRIAKHGLDFGRVAVRGSVISLNSL